jgi:pyruvate/2-oxoglutarate dehydrogenase complex dihydrolipoamide acyltransferase (E2) component
VNKEDYRVVPIPRDRKFSLDAGRMGRGKHIVHGLAEVDVTDVREFIRAHRSRSGERLSFTAYIINCLGEAIDQHKQLQAYRDWRGRLVIFEDVNITTMIEVERNGKAVPIPYVLKQVNRKSYRQIHDEIRSVQANPQPSETVSFMRWFLRFPWIFRRFFYWTVQRIPQWFRPYSSPVMVTAVGMFSRGAFWGITKPSLTLTVALGGIAEKPGVVEGAIEVREFLHLTLSVDHDIVDGAPMARFGNEFMALIEGGYDLPVEEEPVE